MNIEAIDTFIERDEKKEASLQKKETPIETTSRHFREFNNNVPNFLVDGKNEEEASLPELKFDKVRDAETGQEYRIFIINEESIKEGKIPNVLTLQYNIGVDHKPVQYLAQVMGQEGDPIICVESPSVGESSDMTKDQKKFLKEGEKPFEKISESLLRALYGKIYNPRNKDREINFVGYSQGAITALSNAEVADKYGFKVRKVFLLDIPGIKDFGKGEIGSILGITGAFSSEASSLGFYEKDPNDERQREVSGVDKKNNPLVTNARLLRDVVIKPMTRRGMQTGYPAAMGRKVVPAILESALSKQPDMKVTFVSGSKSKITPTEDTKELLKEFNTDRIRRIVLPGDTHSVGERARRLGALFKFTNK